MKLILKATSMLLVTTIPMMVQAQDTTAARGGDSSGSWYRQPWIWVVGAVLFLLLIIAILRGSNKQVTNEQSTVTRHKDA